MFPNMKTCGEMNEVTSKTYCMALLYWIISANVHGKMGNQTNFKAI